MAGAPSPRPTRATKEARVVAEFEDWLRGKGISPSSRPLVGETLVGEAQARAEKLIPNRGEGLSGATVGRFRKRNWFLGRIDLWWSDDGTEWIAEAKDEFTITTAAHALGQVLLYGDLAPIDDPVLRVGIRRAVIFGSAPKGLIEDGPASHGEEILRGYAELFARYEVTIFVRNPGGSFRTIEPPNS